MIQRKLQTTIQLRGDPNQISKKRLDAEELNAELIGALKRFFGSKGQGYSFTLKTEDVRR